METKGFIGKAEKKHGKTTEKHWTFTPWQTLIEPMEFLHAIRGKTHYLDWAMFNSELLN